MGFPSTDVTGTGGTSALRDVITFASFQFFGSLCSMERPCAVRNHPRWVAPSHGAKFRWRGDANRRAFGARSSQVRRRFGAHPPKRDDIIYLGTATCPARVANGSDACGKRISGCAM
jgi:hypothetical protein